MTPEWDELKEYIWSQHLEFDGCECDPARLAIWGKMNEIEARTLPQKVAKIIHKALSTGELSIWAQMCQFLGEVKLALKTGDTSEIEKWVRK